jgi:hypothetical protein
MTFLRDSVGAAKLSIIARLACLDIHCKFLFLGKKSRKLALLLGRQTALSVLRRQSVDLPRDPGPSQALDRIIQNRFHRAFLERLGSDFTDQV